MVCPISEYRYDVQAVMLSTELRVRTCIEMVKNENRYKNHPKSNDFMLLSPTYETACLEFAFHRGWSSIWTIIALSNVIGKNINSTYPPMNGKKDHAYNTLNFVIEPTIASNDTIHVVTKQTKHCNGVWTRNHFAPVKQRNFSMPYNIYAFFVHGR